MSLSLTLVRLDSVCEEIKVHVNSVPCTAELKGIPLPRVAEKLDPNMRWFVVESDGTPLN